MEFNLEFKFNLEYANLINYQLDTSKQSVGSFACKNNVKSVEQNFSIKSLVFSRK